MRKNIVAGNRKMNKNLQVSNSSVGRKVVMSITGIALVLFLTFHMAMNLVALISAEGYNMVCELSLIHISV